MDKEDVEVGWAWSELVGELRALDQYWCYCVYVGTGRSNCMLWRRGSSGVQALTYPEDLLTLTPRAEVYLAVLSSPPCKTFLLRALSNSRSIAPWLFAGLWRDCKDFLN